MFQDGDVDKNGQPAATKAASVTEECVCVCV